MQYLSRKTEPYPPPPSSPSSSHLHSPKSRTIIHLTVSNHRHYARRRQIPLLSWRHCKIQEFSPDGDWGDFARIFKWRGIFDWLVAPGGGQRPNLATSLLVEILVGWTANWKILKWLRMMRVDSKADLLTQTLNQPFLSIPTLGTGICT